MGNAARIDVRGISGEIFFYLVGRDIECVMILNKKLTQDGRVGGETFLVYMCHSVSPGFAIDTNRVWFVMEIS